MIGIGIGVNRQRFRGGGVVVPTFEFTIDTTKTSGGSSTSTQFKLPLTTSTGLNCTVDWGDGNSDTITNHLAAAVTHTYASSGTYTVKITGDLVGWRFIFSGDRNKILDIKQWGAFNLSTFTAFQGCENLTASATDAPIISTASLVSTFRSCSKFNGAIGNWNVSGVTDIANMLNGTPLFNQNLAAWDVNQMTSMTAFMTGALSTANYDALLVSWESQVPKTGISVSFGTSKYTLLSAAATARASLIANYGWTITDGGGI